MPADTFTDLSLSELYDLDMLTPTVHRICRAPKGGEIVEHFVSPDGIEFVRYQPSDDPSYRPTAELRILEPLNPIAMDCVIVNRGEGPTSECDKPVTCHHETRKGDGKLDSMFCNDWTVSPLTIAQHQFRSWARSAPPRGSGYDKCDFWVRWVDASEYGGRFDLQAGGTDDGQEFRESLLYRLRFYAGLSPTPVQFRRKNHSEEYTEAEARRRYLSHINTVPAFVSLCRHILSTCEL